MKDYEPVAFPSVGNPSAGMLCMTVSENRVGLRMPVLDALDRPDRIQIHRGVGKKEKNLRKKEKSRTDGKDTGWLHSSDELLHAESGYCTGRDGVLRISFRRKWRYRIESSNIS